MDSPATLATLLAWARDRMDQAGVDSPWLTAVVLLEHATGLGREAVLAHPELPRPARTDDFLALVERRCRREPLAYLTGYREFYGRRFELSLATLIPRPETEEMVRLALERIFRLPEDEPLRMLDVGTGSGAVAVTLLAESHRLRAVATDDQVEALRVARRNAEDHGVADRLHLVACDLTKAVKGHFLLVVVNLPYVPTGQIDHLQPEVAQYEPRRALDGGPDGTREIRRFLAALPRALAPGGTAILEIGEGQAASLEQAASEALPGSRVFTAPDPAGADRFLVIERSALRVAWPAGPAEQAQAAARAAEIIRQGGLVVYPTDTVYGLGADPLNPDAIRRIYEAKGRPDQKAIIWLLDSLDRARRYCVVDVLAERLAAAFWPGGLTLVLPRLTRSESGLPTLGVRVPNHPAALVIISAAGGAVATTSANRSGEPSARTAAEAAIGLGGMVDLIIDGGSSPGGVESTVVDLSVDPPAILRAGAIEESALRAALEAP